MKPIATNTENWEFIFILCSINLNVASISGTENVQPVFNVLWNICDVTLLTET